MLLHSITRTLCSHLTLDTHYQTEVNHLRCVHVHSPRTHSKTKSSESHDSLVQSSSSKHISA